MVIVIASPESQSVSLQWTCVFRDDTEVAFIYYRVHMHFTFLPVNNYRTRSLVILEDYDAYLTCPTLSSVCFSSVALMLSSSLSSALFSNWFLLLTLMFRTSDSTFWSCFLYSSFTWDCKMPYFMFVGSCHFTDHFATTDKFCWRLKAAAHVSTPTIDFKFVWIGGWICIMHAS